MTKLTENIGNLIILIILNIIPIVNFTLWGYAARIVREGRRLDKPPRIENYVDMFIDGLRVLLVILLYMAIPLIIGFLGIIIAVILGFILLIIGAMGTIHMMKTNSLPKAFAISEILNLIGRTGWGRYIGWLITTFIISIIILAIGSIHWVIAGIIGVFYIVFLAKSAHYIYPEEENEAKNLTVN
ncbi:MAG: DUF4013 domain-containing protein [archaeon GB-1867-097]|nr:DUF4013 domain-containing protein [Candidatus Culexmicrobium thermophilum]MCS7384241.1 DUF4013 domain-containing protein [Candidatus Culexmicrobium thermophilum]